MVSGRSKILDMGRVFAILAVMLYHFYSRHTSGAASYPYGTLYNHFTYGYLGVVYFFILSGYFIMASLKRYPTLGTFWKRKILRFWIPLVICSLITYLLTWCLDTENVLPHAHSWKNLLVSCAFVNPELINSIFGTHLQYVNGSYWFLSRTICFLLLSSAFYYQHPQNFIRNFAIFTITWYLLSGLMKHTGVDFLDGSFSYPAYTNLFLFGMLCANYKELKIYEIAIVLSCAFLPQLSPAKLTLSPNHMIIWSIIAFWMVYAMYAKCCSASRWGGAKWLTILGESTFATYLLHEQIGVLLIHRCAVWLGDFDFMFPIALIVIFYLIGYLEYKYIEKKIRLFVNLLWKRMR